MEDACRPNATHDDRAGVNEGACDEEGTRLDGCGGFRLFLREEPHNLERVCTGSDASNPEDSAACQVPLVHVGECASPFVQNASIGEVPSVGRTKVITHGPV